MKLQMIGVAALAVSASLSLSGPAEAGHYLGELRLFGNNYCPRNWVPAEGQHMSISANQALYSLIATTYGGNGITDFRLPDLRYRSPMGTGVGPGMRNIRLGRKFSRSHHTLSLADMPAHSHAITASNAASNTHDPEDAFFSSQSPNLGYGQSVAGQMDINSVSEFDPGPQTSFNIQQPALMMRWCIAVQASVYPQRN